MLGLARAALLCIPFARIVHWSRLTTLAEAPPPAPDTPSPRARRVRWAIASAARRTPWQSLCLAQALAGSWMLRRRRMAHVLVLGAMPSAGPVPMKAHAWLIHGQRILTGEAGHQSYAVLTRLGWSPATAGKRQDDAGRPA